MSISKSPSFIEETSIEETPAASLALPPISGTTILVVDPDVSTQAALQSQLQNISYETKPVSTSEEALRYLEDYDVSLVITDVFSPNHEGLKLLAFVKRHYPGISVIITTNAPSLETSVEALRLGATDYLTKPIAPGSLKEALKRTFGTEDIVDEEHQPAEYDELEALRASTELFLKNLSLEEVLSVISDYSLNMHRADYCEIFTSDPSDKAFVSTIHRSRTKHLPPGTQKQSRALAIQAIKQQQTLIIDHALELAPLNSHALSTWLTMPFKASGIIVGALCLGFLRQHTFSPTFLRLFSIFIDQASIAISNIHLFEDLTQAYATLASSRAEILKSKNTLQTLFDSITDGLYIVDAQLNIVMVNQAEVNHLQKPVTQILDQPFDRLGWQKAAPELIDLITKIFVTGQKEDWLPGELNKSSLVNNRDIHLYPITSPQGSVQQVIILAQDTTEQKQLQASLFQSASLASLGQLATSVAHEINNPLTIALTNTQLSLMEMDPSDESYEMLEDIYYSCNRIKDIVSNLVDFANQDIYQFTELNLVETIEETLIFIAHPMRKAKADIERSYHYTPMITASRNHLKQAWVNLLLNACEAIVATKEGGKITIDIRQEAPGEVAIHLTDTGIGIPRANFKQIFKPFFTTKPVAHSVGLGLFTARTIIDKHQGEISFTSEGNSTTFTVILPEDGPSDINS